MTSVLKSILVVGGVWMSIQVSYAQPNTTQPVLPTAEAAVYYAVPALTGDPAKDAEIQVLRARDYERFLLFQQKEEEMLQGYNTAARDYLHSVGLPRLEYTGNAYQDFENFKSAHHLWEMAHTNELSFFMQHADELNNPSSSSSTQSK